MVARPEVWQYEPMIYIKNRELCRLLNLKTPYASVADLFDGQRYRLQDFWQGRQETGRKMSPLEKAIVETDEKVGLILMLQKGTLIRPLPKDGSVKPLPLSKIRAELIYNRIPFSKCLFMFNLTVGLLAFFHLVYCGLLPFFGAEWFVTPDKPFSCCGSLCGIPFPALWIWSALVCGRTHSVEQRI